MRQISFHLTTEQIRNRTKTVTRRIGWNNVKPGELLQAIVKGQGIPKGGHVEKLCVIKVESVKRETLCMMVLDYKSDETAKEGFPHLTTQEFVTMFVKEMKCPWIQQVTRIEFSYV